MHFDPESLNLIAAFNPLALIPIGVNLLSGLFGKQNSQSQTQEGTQTQATVGGTAQSQVQNSASATNQATNQNTSQTTNQASQTNQTGNTTTDQFGNTVSEQMLNSLSEMLSQQMTQNSGTQQTQQTGSQVGAVNRLDETTKAMLTNAVQGMLGSAGAGAQVAQQIMGELGAVGSDFDVDGFVSGIMQGAEARTAAELESGTSRIANETGVANNANSAAALLTSRLQQDATANLAATRANAVAQGEEIRRAGQTARHETMGMAGQLQDNSLQQMLAGLLGAGESSQQTSQQAGTTTDQSTSTQTGSQTTNTQEQQTGNTQQQQTTNQQSSQQTNTNQSTNSQTSQASNTATTQASTTEAQQAQTQIGLTETESTNNTTGNTQEGGGIGGLLGALGGMFNATFEGT